MASSTESAVVLLLLVGAGAVLVGLIIGIRLVAQHHSALGSVTIVFSFLGGVLLGLAGVAAVVVVRIREDNRL